MNDNSKLKVRYHDLDALRSFAMILGIAIHGVFSFNGMPIWPAQDINQNPQYGVVSEFIHGFRMQLFFLVSGFFTAMMLIKRGSLSVSIHRTKRILIPLILSVILLVPLMNNMSKLNDFKKNLGKEKTETSDKSPIKGSSIWAAAKRNDIQLLEKKITEGFDVNKKDYLQATPLHWAAAYGNTEAINFLLKNGADINIGDGKNSTPLHWASFMARPNSVKLLMENMASPERKNSDGSNAFQSAELDEGTMKFILGILKIDENVEDLMGRRAETKAALKGKELNFLTRLTGDVNEFIQRNYFINFFGSKQIVLHHFWFLYFLFIIAIGFCIIFKVIDLIYPFHNWSINGDGSLVMAIFKNTLICSFVLFLIVLTYFTQLKMAPDQFGPDTAVFFNPEKTTDIFVLNGFNGKPAWWILLHYFLFFICGAIMYGFKNFGLIPKYIWPLLFFIGFVFLLIALKEFNKPTPDWLNLRKDLEGPFSFLNSFTQSIHGKLKNFENAKPLITSIYCWTMIFGFIGFFKFLFSNPSGLVRYISDSSYWLYLGHQPLVQAYQIIFSDWDMPIYFKFPFVCIITGLTLLVIYHFFIRYSFVGTILNGPRYRTSKSAPSN